MINRCGWCRNIVSDNQGTFKKANQVSRLSRPICEYFGKKLDDGSVQRYFTENGILWSFIAEGTPHRGGSYERLNRFLKEPLKKVLRKAKLNYSEMYTLLADIESTLNQRPLTYFKLTLLKHFWSRWTRDYLPVLSRRNRWFVVVS